MTGLPIFNLPDTRHFDLYRAVLDTEKRAAVRMSGLLQATSTGHLIVGVPTSLVRGVFDAMAEPGISLPSSVDGGALRAAIVVMTPGELQSIGGPSTVTERGKQYHYNLGSLVEAPARNWPGVSKCWHLKIKSSEMSELRKSYGLPANSSNFSIVVACRKVGVLTANSTSKSTEQSSGSLPDWTLP